MAFLGATFDATQVNPNSQFDPLPSGEYPAMIIDSAMKPTKDGTGQYLELTYQIIDGALKGRQFWDRLNLVNKNEKAAQIAAQNFSALCHACNKLQVSDSAQLHNIPHLVRVEFLEAGPKRERSGNEVRGRKKLEGVGAPAANGVGASPFAGGAAAASPAKPAPAAAPGWAQKPAA